MTDDTIIQEAARLVNEGISVTLPVNGSSMLPFIIGGRESVILQKTLHAKVGDVVLALTDDNRFVVHRIIRIDGNQVVLMGDGNRDITEHCRLSDIKAVASHVVDAQGRKRYLYTRRRIVASRLWNMLRPVRRYLLAIYRRL